jgi:glutathione synthase/RimK-type ligase-like ATP-grasp enzyme
VTTFTVLGCLGDRRTLGFSAACRAEGLPDPELVSWARLLDGTVSRPPAGLLRIDSPGGDQDTDTLLRGPGDPARVGGGARWYAAFTSALDRFRAATTPGTTWLNDPADIAVMFDKRRCHARLLAAGVPVPAALGPVSDYAALRAAMASAGWSRVFVKPAHGSSGSGVVALTAHGSRVHAVTSAVPAPGGGYVNSLRAAVYKRESEVADLVDALAPDGLHVERWVPKAGIGRRALDLRVVVIGGVPTHAVVRTSALPITNLQMGGQRGDLDAVRGRLGAERWAQALDVCERAAACFPGSLMVGVDLLVNIGWRRFYVGEVNAFGDLLPGLTGLVGGPAEGLDTYQAQVCAAPGWAARALALSPSGETTRCGT